MAQQRRAPPGEAVRRVRIDLREAQRLLDEAISGGAPKRIIKQFTKLRDGQQNRLRRQQAIKREREQARTNVATARRAGG